MDFEKIAEIRNIYATIDRLTALVDAAIITPHESLRLLAKELLQPEPPQKEHLETT